VRSQSNSPKRESSPETADGGSSTTLRTAASRVNSDMSRNRSVDSSLDKLHDHIASDASTLLEKFRTEFDSTSREFSTKPNVLVAGCTGAGKSTLINKVFGRPVAQTGSGVPITQHFDRYDLENEAVVIYDSKGLEVGEHDNFITTTSEFLRKGNTEIHVVWYIINSAGSRFQPFEGDVCKSLFNKLPIIFILNKADLSAAEDRESLRRSILELRLGNCIGILDTICTPSLSALKVPDVCPACGSDDLDIKRKRKLFMCADCGHVGQLELQTGLEVLVSRSMDALPVLARERFVSAQRISMHIKNITARKIISEFHDVDFRNAFLERQQFKAVAKMVIRLSILWEFREHGHEYGAEIAKEHVGQCSLRDRVFLLMRLQDEEKLAYTTALGVIWNRCVRDLYKSVFLQTFGISTDHHALSASDDSDDVNPLVESSFAQLREDVIDKLALEIEACEFTALLDSEFPSSFEADFNALLDVPLNQQLNGGGAKTLVFTREAMESGPGAPDGAGAPRFVSSNEVEQLRASPLSYNNGTAAAVAAASRQSLAATTGSIANGHHNNHHHQHSLSCGGGSGDDDEPVASSSSSSSRHKHRHKAARGDALVKSCSMNDANGVAKRPSQPNLKTNGLKESLNTSGGNGSVPAPLNSNASAPAAMSKRSTSRLTEENAHLRTKSIK
jgi:GTP-binding protein EngB required for normal cell division